MWPLLWPLQPVRRSGAGQYGIRSTMQSSHSVPVAYRTGLSQPGVLLTRISLGMNATPSGVAVDDLRLYSRVRLQLREGGTREGWLVRIHWTHPLALRIGQRSGDVLVPLPLISRIELVPRQRPRALRP